MAFSGYRTHNEDKTWLFVTKDLGKTWTDISGGMNNPIFDVEEDPDNANVLYLGTDYGIWVTVDQGKTWTAFSTSQPTMVIRDLAIQKRDREMAIGTYAPRLLRGRHRADQGVQARGVRGGGVPVRAAGGDQVEPLRAARRHARRDGARPTTRRSARHIYYYLKADAQKVTVTIKDLEGNDRQRVHADGEEGPAEGRSGT